ncbi:MAG: ATP synthase F1 subunit delta [Calditrichaeota bacterium]|nr:MAG: ATP synthase F1 subunit delta [Calditrichota bacterium]
MKAVVLARRYAKALFELANEKKVIDQVASDVSAFTESLSKNPDIRHFLFSPENGIAKKVEVLEKGLAKVCSDLFVRFLIFLLEKRRQNIFEEIAVEFEVLYDAHCNRIRAVAISAQEINKVELNNLKTTLSKQFDATFELENKIDASMLGGLILQLGGKIYDNSLRNHLKQLEKRLLAEA